MRIRSINGLGFPQALRIMSISGSSLGSTASLVAAGHRGMDAAREKGMFGQERVAAWAILWGHSFDIIDPGANPCASGNESLQLTRPCKVARARTHAHAHAYAHACAHACAHARARALAHCSFAVALAAAFKTKNKGNPNTIRITRVQE